MEYLHSSLTKRRALLVKPDQSALFSMLLRMRSSESPYPKKYEAVRDYRDLMLQVVYQMRPHKEDFTKVRFMFWVQELQFKPREFVDVLPTEIYMSDHIVTGSMDGTFIDYAEWVDNYMQSRRKQDGKEMA